MSFLWKPIDVVKSASQRGLAIYWDRLPRSASMPSLFQFQPEPRLQDPALLMICSVRPIHDGRRYLICHYGRRLIEASGIDGNGRFLDQVVPPALRARALAAYDNCCMSRSPVYTVSVTADTYGREVHYERLLLPFSQDGANVEHIVSSLHLISPDGHFARNGVLGDTARPLSDIELAMIKPGFAGRIAAAAGAPAMLSR